MQRDFSQRHENAVLFITHFWDEDCAAQLARLRAELGDKYDICVIGYIETGAMPAVPEHVPARFYGDADFESHRAFSHSRAKYHTLCGPRFFYDFPGYGHYWLIEYDVRYTGNWADLFAELGDPAVALYATTMQRKAENPAWFHGFDFRLKTGRDVVPEAALVKAFMPITGVSNAGFRAINAAYLRGWVGRHEILWPTSIVWAGLRIEDIGGDGAFTPAARKNKHYTASPLDPNHAPGSFVFRPAILEHEVATNAPLLWHPVKPALLAGRVNQSPPAWHDMRVLRPLQQLNQLWRQRYRLPLRRRWRRLARRLRGLTTIVLPQWIKLRRQ